VEIDAHITSRNQKHEDMRLDKIKTTNPLIHTCTNRE